MNALTDACDVPVPAPEPAASMSGQAIDFLVFGVPRSGTKGLARALSLHSHVYCALERFPAERDHARLTFPQSFLDTSEVTDRRDLEKIERMRAELADKDSIRHVGNKQPRYYLALDRVNRELPELKNLWIYRSPFQFISSWNRREAANRTSRWGRGQVGLFGFLELLICIKSCLRLDKDVFVFPYEAGLNGSLQPILNALAFLGADSGAFPHRRFEKRILAKRPGKPGRLPLCPHEEEMLLTLKVAELDEILGGHHGVLLSAVADDVNAWLAGVRGDLAAAVDRAFRGYPGRAPIAYGARFFSQHLPELAALGELLDGSQAIADLQRFGPLRRLESLFLRRWTLWQRLEHFRLAR